VTSDGEAGRPLLRGERLRLEVEFDVAEEVPGLDLAVFVTTSSGVRVFDEALSDQSSVRFTAGRYRAELPVPPVLNVGVYGVGIWFGTPHEEFLSEPAAATFTVHGSDLARPERVVVLDLPFAVQRLQPPA
jgi:ABC-2 type transport system ATP-binding protein/lipopolysaccharide transport system ATP-binding protein